MPFLITKELPHGDKAYIQRQPDGEHFWVSNKSKATAMTEPEADLLAYEINRFTSLPVEVVGIKSEETL